MSVCGLPVALSAIASVADSAAVIEGLNVMLTVQLDPAGTLPPALHVLVLTIVKSAAFAPVMVMPLALIFSAALPVFASVSVIGPLVVPCC